jgi:tRNA modification GTPase
MPSSDTICAVATPPGEGAVGIVKISGQDALSLALQAFRPSSPESPWRSHGLRHGWIVDPANREWIDEVLVGYMAGPRSYTGEDVVEVNCHSGTAVLDRILRILIAAGCRPAEPGEFTRRAFLNGRIDLSRAEAVAELIHAAGSAGARAAGRLLRGDLAEKLESWRETLLDVEAALESEIDFAEDVEPGAETGEGIADRMRDSVVRPVRRVLSRFEEGRILREGLALALVGKPNVGKSSLLNKLVGRDRAIVTSQPGTTRDIIEDFFMLDGVRVSILDTAGIREDGDIIEAMGVERAVDSIARADAVVWMLDGSRPLSAEDQAVYRAVAEKPRLVVLNKSDLEQAVTLSDVETRFGSEFPLLPLCVFREEDLERLRHELRVHFLRGPLERCGSEVVPNLRQKQHLEEALAALERAEGLLEESAYPELVSLEIAAARSSLESVLGWHVDGEVLDRIFSQFCIGK